MKKAYENKWNTTEMKMLRMDSGVTKHDMIKSERIRKSLDIKETIAETIEEYQLKWFGHVERRKEDQSYVVAQSITAPVISTQPPRRERPPSIWLNQMTQKLNS